MSLTDKEAALMYDLVMRPWIQGGLERYLKIILKDKSGFISGVLQVFECLFSFKPLISHPFLDVVTIQGYLYKRYATIRNYYMLWLKVEQKQYVIIDNLDNHKVDNAFLSILDLRKIINYVV